MSATCRWREHPLLVLIRHLFEPGAGIPGCLHAKKTEANSKGKVKGLLLSAVELVQDGAPALEKVRCWNACFVGEVGQEGSRRQSPVPKTVRVPDLSEPPASPTQPFGGGVVPRVVVVQSLSKGEKAPGC